LPSVVKIDTTDCRDCAESPHHPYNPHDPYHPYHRASNGIRYNRNLNGIRYNRNLNGIRYNRNLNGIRHDRFNYYNRRASNVSVTLAGQTKHSAIFRKGGGPHIRLLTPTRLCVHVLRHVYTQGHVIQRKQPYPLQIEFSAGILFAHNHSMNLDDPITRTLRRRAGYQVPRKTPKPKTVLIAEPQLLDAWERTRGFYVYAWYNAKCLLYIGKGKGNRVIGEHSHRSELLRHDAGDQFRYEILCDDLTEPVALATERCLISLLKPIGNVTHNPNS